MPVELRPYQEECVRLVLEAYKQNPQGRKYIVLPTGSGKTLVFSQVIASLAREYGVNALVIAHREELIAQAADKYRMIKPDAIIGKVGSGIHEYGGEVTVASIQTISRPEHLKCLKAIGYGLIIIDETHHMVASGYQRVLEALPDAFVLGVTATPARLDKKDIFGGEPPLYQATIIEMIQQGYLCNIKAIATRTGTYLDNVSTSMGDFNEHELDLAVNTPDRNKHVVEVYQEYTPGKRAVVFAVTVSHAKALAYTFNDHGIPAAMIAGNTPLEERAHIYKAYRDGTIKVLTNVMVLTEGWDESLAEVCIFARPTQSQGLYIQMGGRVLRLAPGKQHATFLDITDNCLKHRLAPQNFKSALDIPALDGELLTEALTRIEEEEAQEKRALIRKLNEKRTKDIVVNLFGLPEWVERPGGLFVLEVGARKHRIALVPRADGFYDVQARLAPAYAGQTWMTGRPLDWCMQHAEKKARQLLEEPHAEKLVDRNATWRDKPVDPQGNQVKFLKWKKIPISEGMTKGEASDLIDTWKEQDDAKKQAKAERQKARMQA